MSSLFSINFPLKAIKNKYLSARAIEPYFYVTRYLPVYCAIL